MNQELSHSSEFVNSTPMRIVDYIFVPPHDERYAKEVSERIYNDMKALTKKYSLNIIVNGKVYK